jgi:MFS family permease
VTLGDPSLTLTGRLSALLPLEGRFRALRHRDFRRFWLGQMLSVNGTWMQTAAQGWLLYRLTDQALWLGGLSVCRFGPSLLLSPLAGVLADRLDRRRLVIATQTISMVLAAILATLTLAGWISPWLVLAVALAEGLVVTADMPARQVLQVDLVGARDLPSAVGLNSMAFNLARMTGPAAAGLLVAAAGEGWCFAINAASFLGVLIALLAISPRPITSRPHASLGRQLADAGRFVSSDHRVAAALAAALVTSLMGLGYSTILPVVAREILSGDARTYGWLLGAAGLGAAVGALHAAGRTTPHGAGRVVGQCQLLLGLALTALAAGRSIPVDLAVLAIAGFALSGQLTTTNSYLQMTTPEELRGRILSLYVWLFVGSAPISGVVFAALTDHFGAPAAIVAGGVACSIAGASFLLLSVLRHVESRESTAPPHTQGS